jgi:cysteinyl-tRNA synthetase
MGEIVTAASGLQLYNSLGRRLETFVPGGDVVGLYTCGPTVYAHPHLGNMRAYVFADTLRRVLRWDGYDVRHVVNITDVGHVVADSDVGEDKVEVAASRERRSVEEIAQFYTRAFFEDLQSLNILPAGVNPRATEYIDQMIRFAEVLEDKGFTYRIPSGLYFDSMKSAGYGALAMIDIAGQREGARVEHVEGRRHKADFALWRAEPPGEIRAMRWNSPWGWGAPGWHLECSVMSIELLGPHFDIHTGGVDHRELHHVNEIAQSEAYLGDGRPWVRYWLHNEFLQLDAQKIAKSAGAAPRLADLVDAGIHPMAYRHFLLGAHYRAQLDFTDEAVRAAQSSLRRLVSRTVALRPIPEVESCAEAQAVAGPDEGALRALHQIGAAADADLNTPQMLAVLQESLRDPSIGIEGRRAVVAASDALLGLRLGQLDPNEIGNVRDRSELSESEIAEIERLIAERSAARQASDWRSADRLRDELGELGVQVTDTAQGSEWSLR